jgi:hypothetical protein
MKKTDQTCSIWSLCLFTEDVGVRAPKKNARRQEGVGIHVKETAGIIHTGNTVRTRIQAAYQQIGEDFPGSNPCIIIREAQAA